MGRMYLMFNINVWRNEMKRSKNFKEFPITSIYRQDIIDHFEGHDNYEKIKERIEGMSDIEMKEFASYMADAYMNVFWDDLGIVFEERYLNED